MDGLGLAVLGLPVAAALGIRVVSDYLDEPKDDCLAVGPTATSSGTAVDMLTTSVCAHDVTNSGGTAVDMPMVSGTVQLGLLTTVDVCARNTNDVQMSTSGNAVGISTTYRDASDVHISTISAAIDVSNSNSRPITDNVHASSKTDVINITSINANIPFDTFTISETANDVHVPNSRPANDVHAQNIGTTNDFHESNNVDLIADDFYASKSGTADNDPTPSISGTVGDVYASNSGTAVDVMKSNSGTPVDDIFPSCSAINSLSLETKNIVGLEENKLFAYTEEIETHSKLPIKSKTATKVGRNVSFVNNEQVIEYESESDELENDFSNEDSTSSDVFFSLVNCELADGRRLICPSNQRRSLISPHLKRREIDCTLDNTLPVTLPHEENRGNVGLLNVIDRKPTVLTNSSHRCPVNRHTLKNFYCLNNINDSPRNKFVLYDSLKTIGQSQREDLPDQDRPSILDCANSIIHSETREFSQQLKQRSQAISNPLLFASDNNKITNTEKQSNNNLLPVKNKTNLACIPIESNKTKSVVLVDSTRTEYYSGSNQGPNTAADELVASTSAEVSEIATDIVLDQQDDTDQHTAEFSDENSDMKIITDSSTHIDVPETPKSPTRQYTVECPVIEPTSPTGKRCMRKMSLEISLVDSPVAPTSPDGKNCTTDSRRRSSATVHNEQESLKRIGRVDTNNTAVDGRIATAERQQQQNIRAAVPSHPRGRFMYQFAVPRAYVRTVIGEQARVIRRLRQRTGATISVNYPRDFDGCTCTIEGTYSQVLGAVLILRQNFPLLDWSQDEPSEQT